MWLVVVHEYTTQMTVTYVGPFSGRHAQRDAQAYADGLAPGEFPSKVGIVVPLVKP